MKLGRILKHLLIKGEAEKEGKAKKKDRDRHHERKDSRHKERMN